LDQFSGTIEFKTHQDETEVENLTSSVRFSGVTNWINPPFVAVAVAVVADDTGTTTGTGTGTVANTGNTLATASFQVDFGKYTELVNVTMYDSVEVEAVLRIKTDLKTLATVFDPADDDTYYQFVHRDETFGKTFGTDAALKKHNEELSVAYSETMNYPSSTAKFFQVFRRSLSDRYYGAAMADNDRYSSKIIEHIMPRMFSTVQTGTDVGLPKAYLRTDIFSVDKVQSEILSDEKMDILTGCVFRNWLDPSKINEDSDFISTHRSSQDNSVLGYSVNADGIQPDDVLVLNIKFQPEQITGFDSVGRILRVEFIHDDTVTSQTWHFTNQEVYTASGVASDEFEYYTHTVSSKNKAGTIPQLQLASVGASGDYGQFTGHALIIDNRRYDFEAVTTGLRVKDSVSKQIIDLNIPVGKKVTLVDVGSSTHFVYSIQGNAAIKLIDLVGHEVYPQVPYSSFADKRLFIAGEEWNFRTHTNGIMPRNPDGSNPGVYGAGVIKGGLLTFKDAS